MRVLIVGEGKSGTTALMSSIAAELPGATKVFEPKDLGEVDLTPDNLVVKKLHQSWKPRETPTLDSFDKCVYIIRDPRDRLISHLLYDAYNKAVRLDAAQRVKWLNIIERKAVDPGRVPMLDLLNTWWRLSRTDLLSYYVRATDRSMTFFRGAGKRFHLATYEDYVDGRFDALSGYLGFPISTGVLEGSANRVARSGTYGEWRSWFTPIDVKVFRPITHDWLKLHDYDARDWELNEPDALDHGTTVDYVANLFERNPINP